MSGDFFSKKSAFFVFLCRYDVVLLLYEAVVEHIPPDRNARTDVSGWSTIVAEIGTDDEGREASYDRKFLEVGKSREWLPVIGLALFVL